MLSKNLVCKINSQSTFLLAALGRGKEEGLFAPYLAQCRSPVKELGHGAGMGSCETWNHCPLTLNLAHSVRLLPKHLLRSEFSDTGCREGLSFCQLGFLGLPCVN